MTNAIKRLYTQIKNWFYPVYTQESIDHPDRQICEMKCYKNGKYTHTVNMHYFTQEQVERLQGYNK